MNAEIVAVGSELLLGQIDNTNATYLSRQLNNLGVNVYHHTVVGDNEERLYKVLETALNRSDLVITTGGLGPTKDDLTKETLAQLLSRNLVYDKITEERIIEYFKQRSRTMTENNRKQALVIEGSKIIDNHHGLACGMLMTYENKKVMMLPGPPKELIPMFENECIPLLNRQLSNSSFIQSRVLRFFDIGESQLVDIIDDLLETQTNPTIAPLASDGEVTLRLTVKGENEGQNEQKLDDLQDKVVERLEPYFYGTGNDTLSKSVSDLLRIMDYSLSSAESLTGGSFSTELTSLDGASNFFKGGFITYTNEQKHELLGISNELLNKYGAISHECAEALAKQVRLQTGSNVGLSFTGVAGPKEAEGKQPGLVYVGLSTEDELVSYELRLAGSRSNIRERSVKYGLYYLLQWLRKEMKKVDE
ncbi:competence/damage-inducible protein A [Bacillus shivajii]|uniref:competence/damage-inducible protein A n=1 Tax=Bacillus shivajii TaxID=1983719 RepID=UPI001CF94A1A|nr:competence/damage-inducible protein A [Bacillus shivajii]UCZ51658.1 competence/damage-inducible protein A [Bacillus shivajii]